MTFDEWYSTQKHQLGNEQVCRAIWDAAKQDTADIFGSLLQCPCCLEVTECRANCTFATDAPDAAEIMRVLRNAVSP